VRKGRKNISLTLQKKLRNAHLIIKILLLLTGAALFFLLFPFLLKYGIYTYAGFFSLLILFGVLFRIVTDKKTFKVTMLLWATGSIIYMIVAIILILRGVQPLPYMQMGYLQLILYYVSYPLRVLGIFFTGLIFAGITSPAEFLRWGDMGLRIALMYRAFEYSVNSLEEIRKALIMQGEWPETYGNDTYGRKIRMLVKGAPILVSTIFRNIILWFPWAWICYTNLRKEVLGKEKE
jgi:hypothetical protein